MVLLDHDPTWSVRFEAEASAARTGSPADATSTGPDPDAPLLKAAHVHAFGAGHPEIACHLRFRDALRDSPQLRDAYDALKRSLAAFHQEDRARYHEGKAAFIDRVLRGT